VQRYDKKLTPPNFGGRWWSFWVVVFGGFVQNDHYFENQTITQNSGLNN